LLQTLKRKMNGCSMARGKKMARILSSITVAQRMVKKE
jgi:hypothetical protein